MSEQPQLTEWSGACLGDRMGELQGFVDEHGAILAWRTKTGEIEHFELGTFDGRHAVIGRVGCELPIADPAISDPHAELERQGKRWQVFDNPPSANGTALLRKGESDWRPIGTTGMRLEDEDVLHCGDTFIIYKEKIGLHTEHGQTVGPREKAHPANRPPTPTDAQKLVLVELCRPNLASTSATRPTNGEIASTLVISEETVKSHLSAMYKTYEKWMSNENGSLDRDRLSAVAIKYGVVDSNDLNA